MNNKVDFYNISEVDYASIEEKDNDTFYRSESDLYLGDQTLTTRVKGANETDFREKNVILTPDNIGTIHKTKLQWTDENAVDAQLLIDNPVTLFDNEFKQGSYIIELEDLTSDKSSYSKGNNVTIIGYEYSSFGGQIMVGNEFQYRDKKEGIWNSWKAVYGEFNVPTTVEIGAVPSDSQQFIVKRYVNKNFADLDAFPEASEHGKTVVRLFDGGSVAGSINAVILENSSNTGHYVSQLYISSDGIRFRARQDQTNWTTAGDNWHRLVENHNFYYFNSSGWYRIATSATISNNSCTISIGKYYNTTNGEAHKVEFIGTHRNVKFLSIYNKYNAEIGFDKIRFVYPKSDSNQISYLEVHYKLSSSNQTDITIENAWHSIGDWQLVPNLISRPDAVDSDFTSTEYTFPINYFVGEGPFEKTMLLRSNPANTSYGGFIQEHTTVTSNATTFVSWKDPGVNVTQTFPAHIGRHNTGGGGDNPGSIYIVPYHTNTQPWTGQVGLIITKSEAKFEGSRILTAANAPTTALNGLLLTGDGVAIKYKSAKATKNMIQFWDNNTNDNYGSGIKIGGGGALILGAGESPISALPPEILHGETEELVLASDQNITFYTNANNGFSSASKFQMNGSHDGQLIVPNINLTYALGREISAGDLFYWMVRGGSVTLNGITTGYLKIILPVGYTSTMIRFTLSIYNYIEDTSVDYVIGGYNYSLDSKWYKCTAYCNGKAGVSTSNLTVRFGTYDNKSAITIGEANTEWNHLKAHIHDITFGHQWHSDLKYKSWNVSVTTTGLTTTIATIRNTHVGYNSITKNLIDYHDGRYVRSAYSLAELTNPPWIASWTSGSGYCELRATSPTTLKSLMSLNNVDNTRDSVKSVATANALTLMGGDEVRFNYPGNINHLWFNYRLASGTNASTAVINYYFGDGKNNWSTVTLNAGALNGRATSATSASTAIYANIVSGTYSGNGGNQPPTFVGGGQVKFCMMRGLKGISDNTFNNNYCDCILMDTYTGSDVPYVTGLGISKTTNINAYIMVGAKGSGSWNTYREIALQGSPARFSSIAGGFDGNPDFNTFGIIASYRPCSRKNFSAAFFGKCLRQATVGASEKNQTGDAFIIGNGKDLTASSFGAKTDSNALRVTYQGDVLATKAFTSSGADYAEYIYPWYDNNINNEDRIGYFITIKNNKMYFAQPGDYICGITSGNPSVIGNGDENYYWMYERDNFNRIILEDVIENKKDELGNPIITKNGAMKVSSEYDPTLSSFYIPRDKRPEWDCVGMMGVLPVHDDGTCQKDGFCMVGLNGIATKYDNSNNNKYYVLDRISENVIKVLLK